MRSSQTDWRDEPPPQVRMANVGKTMPMNHLVETAPRGEIAGESAMLIDAISALEEYTQALREKLVPMIVSPESQGAPVSKESPSANTQHGAFLQSARGRISGVIYTLRELVQGCQL